MPRRPSRRTGRQGGHHHTESASAAPRDTCTDTLEDAQGAQGQGHCRGRTRCFLRLHLLHARATRGFRGADVGRVVLAAGTFGPGSPVSVGAGIGLVEPDGSEPEKGLIGLPCRDSDMVSSAAVFLSNMPSVWNCMVMAGCSRRIKMETRDSRREGVSQLRTTGCRKLTSRR